MQVNRKTKIPVYNLRKKNVYPLNTAESIQRIQSVFVVSTEIILSLQHIKPTCEPL